MQSSTLGCWCFLLLSASPGTSDHYRGSGTQSSEFFINTSFTADHHRPVVGMNASGGFVVSWYTETDYDFGGPILPIPVMMARRYETPSGVPTPAGSEFVLGDCVDPSCQMYASGVAVDSAGRSAISWTGATQFDPFVGGRQLDANDSTFGGFGEFGSGSDVAKDLSGNVLWIYAESVNFVGPLRVHGMRRDSVGQVITPEFIISGIEAAEPTVAMNPSNGDFVVVYAYPNFSISSIQDLSARMYNGDGSPKASEFSIVSSNGFNTEPDVVMDQGGNFVVVWQRGLDIRAQRFDRAGNTVGLEFVVNPTTAGTQQSPSAAMDDVGNWVVLWQSDHLGSDISGFGIYGQRFNASGGAVGVEFLVNQLTSGDQVAPSVAMNSTDMIAVWQSELGGGVTAVVGRRFEAATVPVFFHSLQASSADGAVTLRWTLYSDEALTGFNVYRDQDGGVLASLSPGRREFKDGSIVPGTDYSYRIGAVLRSDGSEVLSPSANVSVAAVTLSLSPNFPNPFNPSTSIEFTLDVTGRARLTVHDARGRKVDTLVDETLPAGRHLSTWDGRSQTGERVSSGAYFYRLRVGNRIITHKMILIK